MLEIEVVLNDGTNFAVRFNELKAKIEELEAQLTSHIHPVAGANTAVSPQLAAFPTSIDTVKVDKVRL